jgi:hypothetical protein
MMPTLNAYIIGRLQDAGYASGDLSAVKWYDETLRKWRHLGVHQIQAAGATVDVSEIPNDVRDRIVFVVQDGSGNRVAFQWDAGASDFVEVNISDDDFTVTADMLRGV